MLLGYHCLPTPILSDVGCGRATVYLGYGCGLWAWAVGVMDLNITKEYCRVSIEVMVFLKSLEVGGVVGCGRVGCGCVQ